MLQHFTLPQALSIFAVMTGITVIYYIIAWHKVGRDVKEKPLIALYDPPKGMSPVLMKYFISMGIPQNHKLFSAVIVDLKLKEIIDIVKIGGVYCLYKTNKHIPLKKEEEIALDNLFPTGETALILNKDAHEKVALTLEKVKEELSKQADLSLFKSNFLYALPMWILFLISCYLYNQAGDFVAAVIVSSFFMVLATFIAYSDIKNEYVRLLPPSLGIVLLIANAYLMLRHNEPAGDVVISLLPMTLFLVNLFFIRLMRSYSEEGDKIISEITGYKYFLETTDTDRTFQTIVDDKKHIYTSHLLYAIILGIKNKWTEEFKKTLPLGFEEDINDGKMTEYLPKIDKIFDGISTVFKL
ncbi:putative membrane protein (DUF2207) [Parelusimicrobium proximum]|uniref:DUF2207 family protein n=1 Tax=Parelusimicrobium proximum TaxID=3228953 RepID=UPI003D16E26F